MISQKKNITIQHLEIEEVRNGFEGELKTGEYENRFMGTILSAHDVSQNDDKY